MVEGEDNLGYTPVGTERETDSVATGPGVGDGIHVRGKVVPIYVTQQRLEIR